MWPHSRPVGPSNNNSDTKSVAHSVRSLQLCSSNSDSSPSPPPATLPYRRTAPSFRTRRYWNQLERYKTLRGEKKLQHHKNKLEQLCQSSRKSAGGEASSAAAQADGLSCSQEGCPVAGGVMFQAVKRKRSPHSERALAEVSFVPLKTTRRSWRRHLDSSSSSSSSGSSSPPSLTATPAPDCRQCPVTPVTPSGVSHCIDIDLFQGDAGSPLSKATPRKGIHCERGSQTPASISSSVKRNEVKARNAQGDVGSPLAKTTPRKRVHFQEQSRTPVVASSVKSASTEVNGTRKDRDFGSALTKTTPYKFMYNTRGGQSSSSATSLKAKGSVVKTERSHVNSPLVKTTPCPSSSSGTKAENSTGVPASSTEVKTENPSAGNSSNELKLKTKGPHCIYKRSVQAEPKSKTPKTKQKPLPDTPRLKKAKDSALLCKPVICPRSSVSVPASEAPFTSLSSLSLPHPGRQQTPVKKKDKNYLPGSFKKPLAVGTGSVNNPKFKQPKPFPANDTSKGGTEKSKPSGESPSECGATQGSNNEREPNIEQTQLAANEDEDQASDRPATSSAQQGESSLRAGRAPEKKKKKKEPWSKKKYLLQKLAMDRAMSEQSPSQTPSRGSVIQLVTQAVTATEPTRADSASGFSGDTAVNPIQIGALPASCPSTLSENMTLLSTSVLNQLAANPGQSNASHPEHDFRELTHPEPSSCNSKPSRGLLRPDPASSTSTTNSSSTGSTSSVVAEPRGDLEETQSSQPSTETSVTPLEEPSDGVDQGRTASGHDDVAPSAEFVPILMRVATSGDSAAPGTSNSHHGPPVDGLLNSDPNEREREREGGSVTSVPGTCKNQIGQDNQAPSTPTRTPMTAARRKQVINRVVNAVMSMLGLRIVQVTPTATGPHYQHQHLQQQHQHQHLQQQQQHQHLQQQPTLVQHTPNIHASQGQLPQRYFYARPSYIRPRLNCLLPAPRPSTQLFTPHLQILSPPPQPPTPPSTQQSEPYRTYPVMEREWEVPTRYEISDHNSTCDGGNGSDSSSVANITLSPYYQHSLAMAAVYTLAYLFIFLLCMIGNGLVCVIVLRNHHMRTVTNLFILNLAISDLLVGIFCIPTTLVDNLITGWPFSNAVCKVSGLVQGMSVCASVFTLVAIAVDRFRCIVYPFKPKLNLLVAKATIGFIWLLALVIMLPTALMLTVEQEKGHMVVDGEDNHTYPLYNCYETWPDPESRKVYTTVLFAHIYLVPLTLIVLLYSRIGAKLFRTHAQASAEQPCSNPPGKSPKTQRRVRVIKMLVVVTLLFMLSWLPLWTLLLLTDYAQPEGDKLHLLTGYIFPFSHWLAFSNSSVNPIIYGYFNENFKKGFQAACMSRPCCCCCCSCLGKVRKVVVRRRSRHSWARGHREAVLPTNLGLRNRVHTDSDLTGCVHLEMGMRAESGLTVEVGNSGKEGGSSLGLVSTDLNMDDVEEVSPKQAVCYKAWEL
ncbi:hypothetical protein ACEWY4_016545 [Coilia grayii]|uniref:Neuropeptide FF receptor 1 n=1 Tax=Coilia grayii TaxID=363190 RepID=A0ABD1JKW0_9TELE